MQLLFVTCLAVAARANTPLNVGDVTLIIPGGPCWDDSLLTPPALTTSATFTQPGVSGTGVVADISPGQAVTSLNGLKDDIILAPGLGVTIGSNGNTLTISSSLGSDRNLKTGFESVLPEEILARLVALPIQRWRYTNELTEVRHLGPTAQDFKASFGLGSSDTTIAIVDEGGVALTAIQALNQKLEAQMKTKTAEIEALRSRLEELERTLGRRAPDR